MNAIIVKHLIININMVAYDGFWDFKNIRMVKAIEVTKVQGY